MRHVDDDLFECVSKNDFTEVSTYDVNDSENLLFHQNLHKV